MSTFELIACVSLVIVIFELVTYLCSLATNLNADRELVSKWRSIERLLKYYEASPINTYCKNRKNRTRRYGIVGITHLSDYADAAFCGTVTATTFLKAMRRIKKADDNYDGETARKELNKLRALCKCLAEADEKEYKRRHEI